MLDVLVFVDFSLVEMLVKIGRVVIFVRNANANIFRHRIGLAAGIRSSGRGSVSGFDLKSVGALGLPKIIQLN